MTLVWLLSLTILDMWGQSRWDHLDLLVLALGRLEELREPNRRCGIANQGRRRRHRSKENQKRKKRKCLEIHSCKPLRYWITMESGMKKQIRTRRCRKNYRTSNKLKTAIWSTTREVRTCKILECRMGQTGVKISATTAILTIIKILKMASSIETRNMWTLLLQITKL